MDQLRLDLIKAADFSRENFFVSLANERALEATESWPEWPGHCLIIEGPALSGKTHLSHIWKKESGAIFFVLGTKWQDYKDKNIIIDGLEKYDEEVVLHLYNQAKEAGKSILLTTSKKISDSTFILKDLSSRLKATFTVEISTPDDELIKFLLLKLFAARHISIEAEVLNYIIPRLERSFTSISRFVEMTDELSLAEKRNITIPLARQVLEKIV